MLKKKYKKYKKKSLSYLHANAKRVDAIKGAKRRMRRQFADIWIYRYEYRYISIFMAVGIH